ncbi:MAG: ECF transporter S component [Clostridiales bacterium]|nr:ECF transporter S component [Clostridiales bacterium]
MSNKTNSKMSVQLMAMGGLMAALVFVATSFFKLPVSVTQGYIHLGDAFVLISAALLGPVGVAAAAIGSMLADLLGGYFQYCLPTFIIKGAVALVALWGTSGSKPYWLQVIIFVLAEAVMVAGYFIAEWLPLGYGLAAASAAVLPNVVQGASGVIIGAVLIPLLRKISPMLGGKQSRSVKAE